MGYQSSGLKGGVKMKHILKSITKSKSTNSLYTQNLISNFIGIEFIGVVNHGISTLYNN